MIARLPGPFAAWAIFAGLAALAWIGAARPLAGHMAELRARAEIASAQAVRLEARLSAAPRRVERLPDDLVYRNVSAPIATAALLSYLADATERAGGLVGSTLARPTEALEGADRISVQIDATMDVAALGALLTEIEGARPVAAIDLLDAALAGEVAEAGEAVPLQVRLVVGAYLAGEAP